MTYDEMVTFVRTQADADLTDAPDTTLTLYARMAYNDIISRRAHWPHLTVNYELTTSPGVQDYQVSALSVDDMDKVEAIVDPNTVSRRLSWVSRADTDLLYSGQSAQTQGTPAFYTVENGYIILFPIPAGSSTLIVRGQRNQAPWPAGAGSSPDLPRGFDESICYFMLAQYYLSQEDVNLYQTYMGEYERRIQYMLKSELKKESSPRPNIMGGRLGYPTFVDRVRGFLE